MGITLLHTTEQWTGVMYEVLQSVLNSPCHLVVPVKLRKEEPPEAKVGQVFPYLKCLKLEDTSLKKEIAKSVKEGGVAKKTMFSSISRMFGNLELAPDNSSFAHPF